MKKFIALILILLGIWYVFFYEKDAELGTGSAPKETSDFKPDTSQALFVFEDEVDASEAAQLDYKAYGDMNNDERNDTVLLVAVSGGGSGVFIYAAAYVSGPVNYKGTNAIFLGDRIAPQSITISNGVATIKYLDRKEGEPLAAEPTVPITQQFIFKNGELVEK